MSLLAANTAEFDTGDARDRIFFLISGDGKTTSDREGLSACGELMNDLNGLL